MYVCIYLVLHFVSIDGSFVFLEWIILRLGDLSISAFVSLRMERG